VDLEKKLLEVKPFQKEKEEDRQVVKIGLHPKGNKYKRCLSVRKRKMNLQLILILLLAGASIQIEALKNNPSFALRNVKYVGTSSGRDDPQNTINQRQTIQRYEVESIISNIRGGGEVEDDSDSEKPVIMKIMSMFGNTVFGTIFAVSRAVEAGIGALQEEGQSPIGKIFHAMSCMVKATFDKNYEVRGKESYSKQDFSGYLCKAYSVSMPGEDEDKVKIRSGSLSDALSKARSQGRLLVVFVPSSKPKKEMNDQKVIKSLMSTNVFEVAERKARKKEEGGSFMFWSSKYDSAESSVAVKRLKAKKGSGKGKNPILMVVYPSQSMNSSGQVKVAPRVLAQHHCNPPPTAESMAAWLNALRKRHAKQYANMHHELKELELFKERNEGYKSSMKDDMNRENEEKMKEKQRLEEEKAEQEREGKLRQRRESLLEELPDEPEQGAEGVITIAIRFSDGRKGQRRFVGEIEMDKVFNWIDAMFEIEREIIVLTTMNGQKSFSYGEAEGLALEDAGLGKMAAFRLTEKKEEEDNSDNDEEESDEL